MMSRLAQRENELMSNIRSQLEAIGGYKEHRSPGFDRYILPRCRPLAEAIGNRMAYDAAEISGVSPAVLSLYEHICLNEDLDCLPSVGKQNPMSPLPPPPTPYDIVLAQIRSETAFRLDMDDYVTAPITSDTSWESFVNNLQVFRRTNELTSPVPKL